MTLLDVRSFESSCRCFRRIRGSKEECVRIGVNAGGKGLSEARRWLKRGRFEGSQVLIEVLATL